MKPNYYLSSRLFLSVLFTLVLFVACRNDQKSDRKTAGAPFALPTDVQDLGLKSAIKSIRTQYYEAAGDRENVETVGASDEEQDSYVAFDKEGNKTQEKWFDSDGNEVFKTQYNRNAQGKLIEKRGCYPDGTIETIDSLRYDAEGHWIQTDRYDGRGEPLIRLTYQWNEKGQKVRQAAYKPSGDLDQLIEFTYDRAGNRKQETHENGMGERILKRVLEYTGTEVSAMKEYDNTDQLLSEAQIAYDEHGLKLKEEIIGQKGKVLRQTDYSYTLDAQGNWTKQIVFESQKPEMIIEREITYY